MGAKEVSPQEAPGLHAMIERLCIQADLPKPRIAVADTDVPNAFAIGRSQKSATVCATTGIMRAARAERARGRHGPRAHAREEPRRADHDHRQLLRLDSPRSSCSSASSSAAGDDDDNPSFPIVLLVSFAVYIISFFLMLALSRYREFARRPRRRDRSPAARARCRRRS